ncbi:MAG: ATP-binding protein [Bacteroidales bacterium]|nr:ATP-binding protein [Bacteroidales bacterium]
MSPELQNLIKQGEGITLEFKSAQNDLPNTLLETVCAFLNHYGGTILLGVSDAGQILGLNPKRIQSLKKELANTLNNPQLLNPPIYIIPNEVEVDGKTILHLHIHESSQVHSTRGKYFDRNEDGDFNITGNTNLIQIYSLGNKALLQRIKYIHSPPSRSSERI